MNALQRSKLAENARKARDIINAQPVPPLPQCSLCGEPLTATDVFYCTFSDTGQHVRPV